MTASTSRAWRVGSIAVLVWLAHQFAQDRYPESGILAHDTYSYFYPQWLWAREALANGGRGLLWIPLQNCGQPFLGNPQVGLLYPPHWLIALLGPDPGLVAVLVVNQLIGGLGMLWLGRELGLAPLARLIGAVAFCLGNTTLDMGGWSPMHHGPWVWFPAALAATERTIRRPGPRSTVLLAATMALSVLPGYPIIAFFIGLVVIARFTTAVLGAERASALPILGWALGAAALTAGLAAAQLVPSTEMAGLSIRLGPLTDVDRAGGLTWAALEKGLRYKIANIPFSISLLVLAAPSLAHPDPRKRRLALFFLGVIVVSLGVAFGEGSPFYAVFASLPVGSSFRLPQRTNWPCGLALPALIALSADGLLAAAAAVGRGSAAEGGAKWTAVARIALPLLAVLGIASWLGFAALGTLERLAIGLILGVVGITAMGGLAPEQAARIRLGLIGLVGLALVAVLYVDRIHSRPITLRKMLPSGESLLRERALFDLVRPFVGPNGRALLMVERPENTEFALMQKSATVFGVPSIWDYEALVSERFGDVFIRMATSGPLDALGHRLLVASFLGPARVNRPLLDLLATRVIIQSRARDYSMAKLGSMVPLQSSGSADVFLNARARSRAFFVPRIEVIEDPDAILDRLATGRDDLGSVAFVEASPRSGFLGDGEVKSRGSVQFERDAPEAVTLRVTAPARGFVFVSDQLYPGWEATVNGQPVPIERANVAFRLVEVPQGTSLVEMRYRPRSVAMGFGLTLASLLVSLLLWRQGDPPSEAPAAPQPRSPTPTV